MVDLTRRASGISAVGDLPWGSHFCQFYSGRADLVDTLVPYFAAGLRAGERCLWVTSDSLPAAEAEAALVAEYPALKDRLADGQMEIRDLRDWYTPGDRFDADAVLGAWLDRERGARADGYAGLRLSGDTAWLHRAGWDDFMAYEHKVNGAFGRHRVLALCTYHLDRCTAGDVLDVCRTHQFALARRHGAWEMVESAALAVAKEELARLNGELEERVRARTRDLEAAVRARDEFLAMLAHELRNPLAPVVTGLHVLQAAGPDDRARALAVDMMARQTRHLARMVDDLLDVSRVTRGKVHLRPERVDLARLARSAAEDRRRLLDDAGLFLAVETPDTPVWVRGDPTRLAQVVGNLLDNTAKFTPRGGRVAVRVAAAGGRAELAVSDTGVGIDPAMVPRLFEVFSQADRSLDRSRGGLGLGLAVVKGLLDLHGGVVEAHSPGPGRGATFTVRLPLDPEPAALAGPAGPAAAGGPTGLRVAVVEDNRDAADSLRLLLELLGYEVRVAYTGPAGLDLISGWRPEAAVCDLGLPGLDGYALARAVRAAAGAPAPVLVALTGYGEERDRREALAAGFDHHLVKPAEPAALQAALGTAARSR